jgi:hypothetical protein
MYEPNYTEVECLYKFLYEQKLEDTIEDVRDSWEQVTADDEEMIMPEDSELKEEAQEWIKMDEYEVLSYNIEDGSFIDEQRIKDRIKELNELNYDDVIEYLTKRGSTEFLNYIKNLRDY